MQLNFLNSGQLNKKICEEGGSCSASMCGAGARGVRASDVAQGGIHVGTTAPVVASTQRPAAPDGSACCRHAPAENGSEAAATPERQQQPDGTRGSPPPLLVDQSGSDEEGGPPSPYTASYQGSPMAPLLNSYEDPETLRG